MGSIFVLRDTILLLRTRCTCCKKSSGAQGMQHAANGACVGTKRGSCAVAVAGAMQKLS